MLAFLLLEPMIRHISIEKEKPVLLVAIDNSQSMVLSKDSGWVRGEIENNFNLLNEKLSAKFNIVPYHFSSETKAGLANQFNGKETDFTGLFNEVENNYSNRNLGAVLICSDGIFNKGINPLYVSRELKFPVYTLAVGDTTEVMDLHIKKINHNPVAYLGNQFPVEIVLHAKKLKGIKGTLSVSKEGKILEQRPFDISSSGWTQSFNFLFNAEKPGVARYTATVTPAAGEKNKFNNTASFVIDVVDNREKVLILAAAPHPDIAAIKSAIESNKNYEVETALANEFSGPLKSYGLVICHMLPWSTSSSVKTELENKSIPYLLISSSATDAVPGMKINGPAGKFNEVDVLFNSSFSLFTISVELKNYIGNFPPLQSPLGTYNLSQDVNSLLFQRVGAVETENPVIYFTANALNKSGVILGDGIWRWKLRDYADHQNFNLFNELINKSVQYLTVKEDKSFFRLFNRKIFNENEEISFDAEVYNKSYELITEPDVTATITDNTGKKYEYTFSRNEKNYKLSGIFFPPGEYVYEARVKLNGNLLFKKGTFTVTEIISEKVNQVANHQMLYNLSRQTGGKMYYKNQFEELITELNGKDDIKTISYEQKKLTDLINFRWLFFVLLGILTLEWFTRKRNGLY